MARVKGAMMTRKRRNKILGMAKGYWGSKSRHYKMANQAVMKSLRYAYKSHILNKKTTKRKRGLRQSTIADVTNVSAIKRMIPYK